MKNALKVQKTLNSFSQQEQFHLSSKKTNTNQLPIQQIINLIC